MKTYIKPTVKEIEVSLQSMVAASESLNLGSTEESFEAGAKGEVADDGINGEW